ncbi:GNAT family N-acetyltransferase [Paenibacillus sp. 598K]|uniref:diaminobutyrate acetyltransferase n=1 Tax=Paenibacillus sp. 598K TaxID=1117987 RepID=UPI000FF94C35|nr:diaminobutyrate acetyltransferase [Paenibacillus sp. 598K]GBF73342.1 GNAT family N-acetyltransferase [Paenibacillus sp. 598K]
MSQVASLTLRQPTKDDGAQVYDLIRRAGTLDLNSAYCYILLCDMFSGTCVIAEEEERVVGFLSAFYRPDDPETLFVWQAAVDPAMRGRGLATSMLKELLGREHPQSLRYVEATVSPSNTASRRLFQSFADACGVPISERTADGYSPSMFPAGHAHEAEPSLRIGPLV